MPQNSSTESKLMTSLRSSFQLSPWASSIFTQKDDNPDVTVPFRWAAW